MVREISIYIILITGLIFFNNRKLQAQACCTGGAPLSSSLGIKPYQTNSLFIDLSYDFNHMNDLFAGTRDLNDSQRERNTNSALLRISYPVSERFTITGVLPYVWQNQSVKGAAGTTEQSSEGIGDIVLLGQYALLQDKKNTVLLAAGPKFPTGSTSKRDNEFGIILPPDLQPGTGSWDGIGALSYSRHGILRPTLALNALFSYRYSFEVGRYDGQQEYRFGNETVLNIGFSDSFLLGNTIVNPGLNYKWRHTQKDENNGSNFPNTGGSWMYLVPNVEIKITPNLILHSNFEIPIRNSVKGTQLVTSYKGNIGINYQLELSKK